MLEQLQVFQTINIILNKFFKKLKEYNFYNILLVITTE